jgi:hypothetical protein
MFKIKNIIFIEQKSLLPLRNYFRNVVFLDLNKYIIKKIFCICKHLKLYITIPIKRALLREKKERNYVLLSKRS